MSVWGVLGFFIILLAPWFQKNLSKVAGVIVVVVGTLVMSIFSEDLTIALAGSCLSCFMGSITNIVREIREDGFVITELIVSNWMLLVSGVVLLILTIMCL